MSRPKPFDIDKWLFVEAWKRVKDNGGAPGVDGVTVARFGQRLEDNLYRLWNRVSSGTYFPAPVRRVEIAKPGGGVRVLGVPTVADRVVQAVAVAVLEPRVEPGFHPDSYGYRPGRGALDAVGVTRTRCWDMPWVVDMDIRGFFDTIPHDKILAAVVRHLAWDLRWVELYIQRWLAAPVCGVDGAQVTRGRGTPQGAVISPLLANIFMHYAFDAWIAREHPAVRFERYCDDIVVHCASRAYAREVLEHVRVRLAGCGLELNETKTRIVYCGRDRQVRKTENTSFTFLGYTFQPRPAKDRRTGEMFVSYNPAISNEAGKRLRGEIRGWKLVRRTTWTLSDLAAQINPVVRGWINYYGRFYRSRMYATLRVIDMALVRYLQRKYKRFRGRPGRTWRFLAGLRRRAPDLFAHWSQPAMVSR